MSNKRFWGALTPFLIFFLLCGGLMLMVSLPVAKAQTTDAQATATPKARLLLPLIHKAVLPTATPIPTPPPGSRAPLSVANCEEVGYVRSSALYPNGTTVESLQAFYRMHPGDFASQFRRFFLSGVVNVHDGTSTPRTRVCLPLHYSKAWSQVGDPDFSKRLYIDFTGDRPEWASYLENGAAISASPTVTESLTILGFAITGESWFGATVIGTVKLGDGTLAKIARVPGASQAAKLLGRSIAYFPVVSELYRQIDLATSQGVNFGATALAGSAAIVYYAKSTNFGYFQCYPDAVAKADSMVVGEIRQLYLFKGESNAGCIIASIPLDGVGGNIQRIWDVLTYSGVRATQKGRAQTVPLTHQDAKDIAIAVQEWFDDKEPVRVPTNPEDACTRADVDWFQNEATDLYKQKMDYILQNMDQYTTEYINELTRFADDVRFQLFEIQLYDWYEYPNPRLSGDQAHLTNQGDDPDDNGQFWNIELICRVFPAVDLNVYGWALNPSLGWSETSIVRNDDPKDFKPKYPYAWNATQ